MTREALHNAIRSRFEDEVASSLPVSAVYDNAPDLRDDANLDSWVRWSVRPGETRQRELGAVVKPAGKRTVGVAIAQVFTRVETGDRASLAIQDAIIAAFDRVTAGGVTYRTPSTTIIGRDPGGGPWWQVNVTCPWYADGV